MLLILLAATLVLAIPAHAEAPAVPYSVKLDGPVDTDLPKLLRSLSDCFGLRDAPPATRALLEQRMQRDLALFRKALHSRGRFGGTAKGSIEGETPPLVVHFHVTPGPVYRFRTIRLTSTGSSPHSTTATSIGDSLVWPRPSELGLRRGSPVRAVAIVDAEPGILTALGRQGYPLATVVNRRVVVCHEEEAVDVTYEVDPGPWARFGETHFEGLTSVRETYVRHRLTWKRGDPYDQDRLRLLRRRLTESGLFGSIRILPGSQLNANGELPITIRLGESRHRTLSGGVSYKTDFGAGAQLNWEHRNYRGKGERLGVQMALTQIGFTASGLLRKPDFRGIDQDLLLEARIAEDSPDAYTSRNVGGQIALERTLADRETARAGLAFKASEVDQRGLEDTFGLFSIPVAYTRDRSNDLLDPTRGHRLQFELVPTVDPFGQNIFYTRAMVRWSHYLPLEDDDSLVVATRGVLGSLAGTSRLGLPADERFYAGGGGSIRGYTFQSVGPNDPGGTRGGRSLLELSIELRRRLTDELGLVAFVDGGGAFLNSLPSLGDDLFWGVGLGFRYFTPVGPVRLDLAVPLNRRAGVDDGFQLYLSVGQAF